MRKSGAFHLTLALAMAVGLWSFPVEARRGFDCAKASLKVDYAICRSAAGMQAIGELQAAWDDAYATVPPDRQAPLLREQRQWIDAYAADCGVGGRGVAPPDPSGRIDACVVDRLRQRTAQLRSLLRGAAQLGYDARRPAPQDDPARDAAQDFRWRAARQQDAPYAERPPTSADDQTYDRGSPYPAAAPADLPRAGAGREQWSSAGLYPIEQLRHPLDGLRPLQVETFQGRPLFPSVDQGAFFLLVALGMKPDLIQSDAGRMSAFAGEFLARDNPYRSLDGVDEFAARDKRREFLAAYADKLRRRAPRVPFEFAYRFDADLPEYDSARRGFSLRMQDIEKALLTSGVRLVRPSNWPSGFWPASAAEARAVLENLRREEPQNGRRVRIVAVLRAVAANSNTMTLNLKLVDLAAYNPSMTRKLHDFPAGKSLDADEAGASAVADNDSLAALARSPAGLQPWTLQVLNGLPILDGDARRFGRQVNSNWPTPLTALAMFMGAANVPGEMERDPLALAQLLLDSDAKDQVLARQQTGAFGWRGASEFEKGAGEALFFQRYAPLIREAAPRPPFRFIYLFDATLPQYDQEKAGFQLKAYPRRLTDEIGTGGLIPEPQFSWPDIFWKVTPKDAEALFAEVSREQARNPRPGLVFAAEIEAASLEPTTKQLRLRLRSLKLYTPDLSWLVHEFPVTNDAIAFSSGGLPRALRLAPPVVLDKFAECAVAITAFGGDAPRDLIRHCFNIVAQRDSDFYRLGGDSAGLAADDSRRPFFRRSGPGGSDAERTAFIAWAKSYAAGVPDTVLTVPVGPSAPDQNGDVTFPLMAGDSDRRILSEARLDAEGLGSDQIVRNNILDRTDFLMSLPAGAQSYGVVLPRSAFEPTQGESATAQSVIRLGKPRVLQSQSGAPVILIEVTPVSTEVKANGKVIGQRNYQDVATVGETFTNPPPTGPRPVAAGPIRLDAPVIDLLIASSVGDRLSRRALAHMVLRRREFENLPDYAGPRFFAPGKRAPNPQEAAGLGPEFVRWANAITPAPPLDVLTSGPMEIGANQTVASWGAFACFGGSFASLMQDVNSSMAANADLATCERRGAALASDQKRACAAARAISRTRDYLRLVGGMCQARDQWSSIPDPLSVAIRLPHDLPTPSASFLEDKAKLLATVTLKLSSLTLSDTAPNSADVLPESVTGQIRPPQQTQSAHDFVTLDTAFLEAAYFDARSRRKIASLGPDRGGDVASIMRDFDNAVAEIARTTQTPSVPYGPDLMGIRLGMNFDEAEAIIRQHMGVGNVYQGTRATDAKARAGFPKGFTSGRLFLSADAREMIALIDEPPAAPGKVLAAWRRVLIEPGTVPPEQTLAALRAKYGPPSGSPATPVGAPANMAAMRVGSAINWHTPRGERCASLYAYGPKRTLSDFWTDNGAPAAFPGAGAYQAQNAPMIPEFFLDPLGEQARQASECGPFLTAFYLQGAQRGGGVDTIDTMISDIDAYRDAFVRSREMLQATPAAPVSLFQGPYGPDVVGVRLGMTLDEAQGVIGRHMKGGGAFRIAGASPAPGAAGLPGSGLLFVSQGNDDIIAVFDAPHPGEGHVAAVWRRVYSPLAVDLALVTRRAIEKYGVPAAQGDAGRLLVWGAGLPMICGAADAQIFQARAPLVAQGLDDAAPFHFRAADGETSLSVPMIDAPNPPAGVAVVPSNACGPRIRVDFQPDQGDPPMNVTETILTDPGLAKRILEISPGSSALAAPVKF